MKRRSSQHQQDDSQPKMKFSDFKDAWVANSREFYRSRPMVVALALHAAARPIVFQRAVMGMPKDPLASRIYSMTRRVAA